MPETIPASTPASASALGPRVVNKPPLTDEERAAALYKARHANDPVRGQVMPWRKTIDHGKDGGVVDEDLEDSPAVLEMIARAKLYNVRLEMEYVLKFARDFPKAKERVWGVTAGDLKNFDLFQKLAEDLKTRGRSEMEEN